MDAAPGQVTRLLRAFRSGNPDAERKLLDIVYNELHGIARRYMRRERSDHTLQPTALVHEAYVHLVGQRAKDWQNRAHFYGVAAQIMRRILVDYARSHEAAKRGGGKHPVRLEHSIALSDAKSDEV